MAVQVRSGIAVPLRVTSLSLTPAAVDATTSAQTVTADIGIASEAAFTEGALALQRANFSGVTEISLGPDQRISGAATEGVYRVSFAVSQYSVPGTWLLEAAVSDVLGREAVFGRGVSAIFEYDHVLPDGLAGLLAVVNTGVVDETPPALPTFTRSPAVADVTALTASLTFTFRITDSLSGFGSAVLMLYAPNGEALAAVPVSAAHRTSGTALDGIYTLPFALPSGMPGGTWTVALLVRDGAGNPSFFDGAIDGEEFPLGTDSAAISVTGAPHGYWLWMYPRLSTDAGVQPADDLDGDGASNLLEFAFGLSPGVSDVGSADFAPGTVGTGLPTSSLNPAGLALSYVRRKAGSLSGLTYTTQFASLPGAWTGAGGGVITGQNETFERVTVNDASPGGDRRFARVKVVLAR